MVWTLFSSSVPASSLASVSKAVESAGLHSVRLESWVGLSPVLDQLQLLLRLGLRFVKVTTLCQQLPQRAALSTVIGLLTLGVGCLFSNRFLYHLVLKLEGRYPDGKVVVLYLEFGRDSRFYMAVVEGEADEAQAAAFQLEAEQRYGDYMHTAGGGRRELWERPMWVLPHGQRPFDPQALLDAIRLMATRPYNAIDWNCRTFVKVCREALEAA